MSPPLAHGWTPDASALHELTPYPTYKDSGLPWVGRVPAHWRIERAKALFRKMERPARESDEVVTCFRDGLVTLRRNRRVRGFTESLKEIGYQGIRRGDLVIHAMDASAGAVGVADSDGKGTPVYSVCQPLALANAHYFAYLVREMARSQWIAALAKGIRERSTDFRFEAFASGRVPLAPIGEQATIVRFLNHADRRIRRYTAAKQKLIKLLEEQKQAIIRRAVTQGLDPDVGMRRSALGWLLPVPEHWKVVPLGALSVSIQTGPFGSQLHANEYVANGTPVVNPSHILHGRIRPDSATTVDADTARRLARHALQTGDIVMARRGELGRCAVVEETAVGWLCGTGSLLIRPRADMILPAYAATLIGSQSVRDILNLRSIGATMSNLNAGIVASLQLPCPPVEEQQKILAFLSLESERSKAAGDLATSEMSLLREYRTRLVADVVTGKLDVRAAAASLPDDGADPPPDLGGGDGRRSRGW